MIFHFMIIKVHFVFLLIEFHCTFSISYKNITIFCLLLLYLDQVVR